MAWPTDPVATGELITAAQLNGLPVMIANTTLVADTANIDFTSIPGHYAHLMLVCYLRGDNAVVKTGAYLRFNNDSAANYDYQVLYGIAAAPAAGETFASTVAQIGNIPSNSAGANLFGEVVIDVAHYANASNNKVAMSHWAHKSSTTTGLVEVGVAAQFWRSNAAITRVTILPVGLNWKSGSRVTLYGVPG